MLIDNISIHAPRVGSDVLLYSAQASFQVFQSTLPVWGATVVRSFVRFFGAVEFQSTLPVWGATSENYSDKSTECISIHAPRVGSDHKSTLRQFSLPHFNPRSPCGERRNRSHGSARAARFQSTLPVWGATRSPPAGWECWKYFNPRSPCGERPKPSLSASHISYFNPRSPCGERRGAA